MNNNENINAGINKVITEMMDKVMDRVLFTDPFIKENHHLNKPLYAALVPDEIFKGSHFERRFVTPFGGVWEKLAQVVAQEYHGHCEMGKTITGVVGIGRLRRIQEVLNRLESGNGQDIKTQKDWNEVLKYILKGRGKLIPTSIHCDIYIESKRTNEIYAFVVKGHFPDRFQTQISKEKILKLLAMKSKKLDMAYFAIASDIYNENIPQKWFDMKNDKSLLIGKDFWELIGGKEVHRHLTTEIDTLSEVYKEQIYKEVLGVTPII